MQFPDKWKTQRQVIIETYIVERSPKRVSIVLHKDLSYVSRVIRAYKKFLEQEYDGRFSTVQTTQNKESM